MSVIIVLAVAAFGWVMIFKKLKGSGGPTTSGGSSTGVLGMVKGLFK